MLAAWEEVLAGSPSAHRINILFLCLDQIRSILVVEGDSTGPEGGRHIVLEGVRIEAVPEGGRSSYDAVSGYTNQSNVLMRDLRLLGLLGVVVGHFGSALRRSDCSQ